jgi:hypothetical protein
VILARLPPCSRHGRSVIFLRSPLRVEADPPHVNHDLMTDFAVEVPADGEDDLMSFDAPAEEPKSTPVDRADAPVSEVTERFLRAVIAKVPLDRIEELHLFAPLRQGGIETGIAVVAARAQAVVESAPMSLDGPSDVDLPDVENAVPIEQEGNQNTEQDAQDEAQPVDLRDATATDLTAEPTAELTAEPTAELTADETTDGPTATLTEDLPAEQVHNPALDVESSPYADEASGDTSIDASLSTIPDPIALASDPVDHVAPVVDDLPPAPRIRHTVYTARYRLVLKGPERGRWEADVVDEADAPLLTVETVVRGVQRRAGEETEILRYSERQIARALRMDWPVIADVPAA